MVMTYNSLVAQVLNYVERDDDSTVNEVPNFIYQAEQRICRECKTIGLQSIINDNFIIGTDIVILPPRWRRTISLNYGSGAGFNTINQMYHRTYEFCRNYSTNAAVQLAPLYYADYNYGIIGASILIAPTPDLAYPYEMSYIELPTPIDVNNQTNWLTNFAPDVLLYATLIEAAPFLKNTDSVGMWKEYYDRGLASLNGQGHDRKTDRQSDVESV